MRVSFSHLNVMRHCYLNVKRYKDYDCHAREEVPRPFPVHT